MTLHGGGFSNGQPVVPDLLPDLAHRSKDSLVIFAGGKKLKAFFGGKFHVDTHTVCQITDLLYDLGSGSRHGFCMDIAPEMVLSPQEKKGLIHQFHGIGGIFYYSGA